MMKVYSKPDPFYLTKQWRALRLQKLNKDPLCECCMQSGRVTVATVVHHMLDIDEYPEYKLNIKYLMSLCVPCHSDP